MPGLYIHMSVADHVRDRLAEQDAWQPGDARFPIAAGAGPSPQELARLAAAHPNYYALGAIGPDLFFLLADFRSGLGDPLIGVVSFANDLMTWLDEWILDRWERYFGPTAQNIEETISRLTGDLSTVAGDVIGSFIGLHIRAAMVWATYSKDWFAEFSLGHNRGFDNRDFLWSDMLHYRRTSRMGMTLWRLAGERESRGDPDAQLWADRLRAYAVGYMTHLATDTTGHGFTNEKAGGPFRTQWQRHKLVENHMDARAYDREHGADPAYNTLISSAGHYRIAFTDSGGEVGAPPALPPDDGSLRANYVRRRRLDLSSQMPMELAEFLFAALERNYNTGTAPDQSKPAESSPRVLSGDGRPAPGAIQDAYWLFFGFLRNTYLDGFDQAKPRPPELFPNLDFPQLTDPADDPPSPGDEELDILDMILAILRFLLWLAAIAVWLVTLPIGVLMDVVTYGPRNAAYYGFQLPLYYATKALRWMLVMTGYLFPDRDEIAPTLTRIGMGPSDAFLAVFAAMDDVLTFIDDAQLALVQGRIDAFVAEWGSTPDEALTEILTQIDTAFSPPTEPSPDEEFPRQHERNHHHKPWRYPRSDLERGATVAGPFQTGDDATLLVASGSPGEARLRSDYEKAGHPNQTDDLSRTRMDAQRHLGDPISFSSYLVWQLTRTDPPSTQRSQVTDWNLDADRGYAYHCWDWDRDPRSEMVLTDADGHEFLRPCTPPSQSDPDAAPHDPNRPLAVHYASQQDPHCEDDR